MTAILAIVAKDGVVFYTDGAAYDRDGRLYFADQKADIMLHLPCIMATRGEHKLGAFPKFLCSSFEKSVSSFDGLVDTLPVIMIEVAKVAPKLDCDINLCAFFGGWSARSGRWELHRAVVAGESPDRLDGGAPQVVKVASATLFEPEPPHDLLIARGLLKDGMLDLRNGDASIIEYMQCQREAKFAFGRPGSHSEETGCIVGCFIQKTALTRDDATTEIIHRWPDEIGKPLGSSF
jgi:hypothetical protein